jgi:phospho-N-acetylmuramoyl-pentapeptide-transferase
MLYELLYPLHTLHPVFNVFRYITFRTIYAVITALLICFVLGPWFIRKLTQYKIGQYVRDDGPPTHKPKQGTPTMGGVLILFSVVFSTLLWARLTNPYIWVVLFVTLVCGAIGFVDDYYKLFRRQSKGLSGRKKLIGQIAASFLVAVFLYVHGDFDARLSIPFFKDINPNLGLGYILLTVFIITGTSNAVNLTDGLDGLAIGPGIVAFGTYLVFCYVVGHAVIARYLQIAHVPGTGELTVFCGSMVGAGVGFLWYNTYPAQIFMGDTGSLALGGALGTIAVLIKQEILLVIVGGIFVMEALSVIFQVGYFKLTNGRRIFRMAPLHHHFELKGWAEPKVIVRFWIIAFILSLIGMSTLKLR